MSRMTIYCWTILVAKQKVFADKKARLGIASLFCLLSLLACNPGPKLIQHRFEGSTMGTQYHVSIVVNEGDSLEATVEPGIHNLLADIDQQMSTYIESSDLSNLNRAPVEAWLPVSEQLFAVLELAQNISRTTAGAFDITVGPLVNLWGFGPTRVNESSLPSEVEIQRLKSKIGFQQLQLNSELNRVKKSADIYLDLSAIAKGFAADQASEFLSRQGLVNHMVEIGGEIKARGYNSQGNAWRIGIEKPVSGQGFVQQAISISDVGVATSGDYRNYYEVNGRRYSHTIDPATGKPITHNLASVTVIASTAAEADAYATAFSVMGVDQAKLIAEDNNLAVYFIVRDGESFSSDANRLLNKYL